MSLTIKNKFRFSKGISFKISNFWMLTLSILLTLTFNPLLGQNANVEPLTESRFLQIVRKGHPVVMRSNLLAEKASGNLREAKGAFDPKFYGKLNQKYFDDKEYYRLLKSGIRIPSWFGITVNAGIEDNGGVQLNPESLTPETELWYAGLSVPIGQGLFIDKRRAELRKAKVFIEQSEAERKLLVNEIMLGASSAYWSWYEAYFGLIMAEEVLSNAEQRLYGVIQSAERGDKPYIDTLEAAIQVQMRRANKMTAQLHHDNQRLFLETFLWKDGLFPLELTPNSRPRKLDIVEFSDVPSAAIFQLDSLSSIHPKLMSFRNEIQMKKLDLKFQKEFLKPKINLKYNALTSAEVRSDLISDYNVGNYNWGLEVSMPLFLRKERGRVKLAQVKVNDMSYKLADKVAQINYKAKAALNKLENSREQFELYELTVENYRKLYESEVFLFESGESSLFLVNSREKAWLDARMKLLTLKTKSQIAEAELNFHLALFE